MLIMVENLQITLQWTLSKHDMVNVNWSMNKKEAPGCKDVLRKEIRGYATPIVSSETKVFASNLIFRRKLKFSSQSKIFCLKLKFLSKLSFSLKLKFLSQ